MCQTVIAFPLRPRRPDTDLARLEDALTALVRAVDWQAAVTREYRDVMRTLDATVQDLGRNVGRYEATLTRLGSAVQGVRDEAGRLAVTIGRAHAA